MNKLSYAAVIGLILVSAAAHARSSKEILATEALNGVSECVNQLQTSIAALYDADPSVSKRLGIQVKVTLTPADQIENEAAFQKANAKEAHEPAIPSAVKVHVHSASSVMSVRFQGTAVFVPTSGGCFVKSVNIQSR